MKDQPGFFYSTVIYDYMMIKKGSPSPWMELHKKFLYLVNFRGSLDPQGKKSAERTYHQPRQALSNDNLKRGRYDYIPCRILSRLSAYQLTTDGRAAVFISWICRPGHHYKAVRIFIYYCIKTRTVFSLARVIHRRPCHRFHCFIMTVQAAAIWQMIIPRLLLYSLSDVIINEQHLDLVQRNFALYTR